MTSTEAYNTILAQRLLSHFEWRITSRSQVRPFEVWRNSDFPDREIILPTDPSKGDYLELLDRVFRELLQDYGAEAGRTLDFLRVQSSAALNATKWIKETPVSGGLIRWDEGEKLIAAAKGSLAAAAKATKESRRYYGNAANHIAKRFLEESYMGQTEVGSFVVTAYTPSNQRFYFSEASEETAGSQLLDVSNLGATGTDILVSRVVN